MRIMIARAVLDRLRREMADSPQAEVCGLLLGTDTFVHDREPARNISPNPRTAFEIDPVVLLRAAQRARTHGVHPLGYYHSHLSGEPIPSLADANGAQEADKIWLILSPTSEAAYVVTPTGLLHGRFQPVTLSVIDESKSG
jgi:desampylase